MTTPGAFAEGTFNYDTMTVDHFIPKASGGCNSVKNKVAACYACNQARGCMEPSVPRAAVMKRREMFVKRWEQKRRRNEHSI